MVRDWPVALMAVLVMAGTAVPSARAGDAVILDRVSGCRVRETPGAPGAGIRWTGPCRGGFAQGGGVLEWFLDNEPAGWAEGTFRDGRLEGTAHVEWADGRRFTGTYRRGQAAGPGVLTFPEGHRYVGRFARNRPTGQGEYISAMGTRYAARLDDDGGVRPGPMLGERPVSAPAPVRPAESLDEWLREPPPVPDLRLSSRLGFGR